MSKSISRIKTGSLQRRLSVSMAWAKSGSGLAMGKLGNMFKSPDRREQANEELLTQEARRFVAELGKLKGAYVKIGQMLAIYGVHVLPKPITQALQGLNDQTAPLDWPVINAEFKQALGQHYCDFDIDKNPIAAASLAQVHKALHKPSGRQLCLKIRYPGIAETIDNDFQDVIKIMALARWLKKDPNTLGFIEELHGLLHQETDYLREARMSQHHKSLLTDDDRYLVPQIYPEFSTEQLLVMDFVDGYNIDSPQVSALPQQQRNTLARAMLDLFFREIFVWRLIQTDPNLGNYLVCIESGQPKLALLDFGAVRQFDTAITDALCRTIIGAVDQDMNETINGLEQLGCLTGKQSQKSRELFARFCFLLVEPFNSSADSVPAYALNSRGQYRWGHANLVRRAAKLGASSAFTREFSTPPPEFALITRKLSGVYAVLATLNAEFNADGLLKPYTTLWQKSR